MQTCELGISTVCELFHSHIVSLCSIPQDSNSDVDNVFSVPLFSSITLFIAVDSIILFNASCLTDEQRNDLEQSIYKALLSMLKGTYSSKLPNSRKLQRSLGEGLRTNVDLQGKLMQMAFHFICNFHREGVSSFIVSILKRCCENSIGMPSLNSVATEILGSLDMLLMPSSLVIPQPDIIISLRDKIVELSHAPGRCLLFMQIHSY